MPAFNIYSINLLSPEGFVKGSKPAGVTAWTVEDQPEQGETKVGSTSTTGPPSNTSNDIKAKDA